jgi:hypothetical protein
MMLMWGRIWTNARRGTGFRAKLGAGAQLLEGRGKLSNIQSMGNKKIRSQRTLAERIEGGVPLAAGERGRERIPRAMQFYFLAKQMLKGGQFN